MAVTKLKKGKLPSDPVEFAHYLKRKVSDDFMESYMLYQKVLKSRQASKSR